MKMVCPKCGRTYSSSAFFCEHCNVQLVAANSAAAKNAPQTPPAQTTQSLSRTQKKASENEPMFSRSRRSEWEHPTFVNKKASQTKTQANGIDADKIYQPRRRQAANATATKQAAKKATSWQDKLGLTKLAAWWNGLSKNQKSYVTVLLGGVAVIVLIGAYLMIPNGSDNSASTASTSTSSSSATSTSSRSSSSKKKKSSSSSSSSSTTTDEDSDTTSAYSYSTYSYSSSTPSSSSAMSSSATSSAASSSSSAKASSSSAKTSSSSATSSSSSASSKKAESSSASSSSASSSSASSSSKASSSSASSSSKTSSAKTDDQKTAN